MATNDWVTCEVKGLDELQKKLEELPHKIVAKGLRKALRAGANVFFTAMVELAPKDTGFLSQHFGSKLSMARDKDELAGTAYIGPKGKIDYPYYNSGAYKIKRDKKNKAHNIGRIAVATVARFLEFGVKGHVKKPFMTQAFESSKQKALDAVTTELSKAVEDAANS